MAKWFLVLCSLILQGCASDYLCNVSPKVREVNFIGLDVGEARLVVSCRIARHHQTFDKQNGNRK